MSLIYTAAFVGSLIPGSSNADHGPARLRPGMRAPLPHLISYLLCGTGVPYPVFLVGYAFNGLGLSVQDAQVNSITLRLPNAGAKMAFVPVLGWGARWRRSSPWLLRPGRGSIILSRWAGLLRR